jgi:hypothetical protein
MLSGLLVKMTTGLEEGRQLSLLFLAEFPLAQEDAADRLLCAEDPMGPSPRRPA